MDVYLGAWITQLSTLTAKHHTKSQQKDRRRTLKSSTKRQSRSPEKALQKGAGTSTTLLDLLLDDIKQGLADLGWVVCDRDYQICKEPVKSALVVMNSDLVVLEGVPAVTIPVGSPHEWTMFSKGI